MPASVKTGGKRAKKSGGKGVSQDVSWRVLEVEGLRGKGAGRIECSRKMDAMFCV